MAFITVSNIFVNATTASASEINTNFLDLINGTSDGTKDFSIAALTCSGTLTANGNVTLGNSASDDLTITASLASSIGLKTTYSYEIGSTTIGLKSVFMGSADSAAYASKIVAGTLTASNTLTLPTRTGTVALTQDSFYEITNCSIAASVGSNQMTISIKTKSGSDASSSDPIYVGFRSATAATGTYVQRSITGALSITIPNTATLGTTNAVEAKYNVYLIDNAGTVELAVSNLGASTTDGRVTTTAIDTSSDSATVVYSASARTNVACMLIGAVVHTQATAGTYATTPSAILLKGCGISLQTASTDWASFSPTGAWSSNTTYTGRWSRIGDSMLIQYFISTSGAPTSATLTLNLPSGYTIDSSKLAPGTATEQPLQSRVKILDSGTAEYQGDIRYSSTTALAVRYWDVSGTLIRSQAVTQAAPMTFASGDTIAVDVVVPIIGWFSKDWQLS